MRKYLAGLVIALVVAMTGVALAQTPATNEASIAPVTVVKQELVHPPRHITHREHFVPWAHPTVGQVRNVIIPYEAKRWGGGPLYDRIGCESTFNYGATNGTYNGLIQTDWHFWSGAWQDVLNDGARGVRLVSRIKVRKPVKLVQYLSDGRTTTTTVGKDHVTVKIIRIGKLPKNADEWHGWAAVRVGQRAVSGDGPTTYWACTHNGSHY